MASKSTIIIADPWDEEVDSPPESMNATDGPFFLGAKDGADGMSEASSTADGLMDRMQVLYEFLTEKKVSELDSELDLAPGSARSNGTWKL